MNRLFIIFFTFIPISAMGQDLGVVLQGSVQDGFLERGLFGCKVTLMRDDSTMVECYPQVHEIGNDSIHVSTIYYIGMSGKPGNYLVRVQKDGYEDGWAKVNIPEGYKGNTLKVPMINMRKSIMRNVNLDEVVVKATRIKVKMRGDTLVYDATAFQLPEGSMLQHLIEQLPGARMTDEGEIFINGRKIDELTLNSRSLFRGNKKVLLENLPYFTVKELKVYERQSLQAAIRGIKDEYPEYVMDVNLKDEYSVGVIANAEAAGGTHERYQTRAFGLLLTKTMAVSAFGNLNNTNDITRAIAQGWNEGQGLIFGNQNKPSTRKATGVNIDYQPTKKWNGFPAIAENIELAFDRYNDLDESGTYQERFLPTGTSYSERMHTSNNKITAFQVINRFYLLPVVYESHIMLYYKETDNSVLGSMRQWLRIGEQSSGMWDSQKTTATQQTDGLDHEKEYGETIYTRFMVFPKLVDGQISAYWSRAERDAFNRQNSISGASSSDCYRHEYQDNRTTDYKFEPTLSFFKHWTTMNLYLTERYQLTGNNSNDQLYILNNMAGWGQCDSTAINLLPSNRDLICSVYDTENSSESRLRLQENEFTMALKWNKTERFPVEVTLTLPVFTQHEKLDYERGVIDTLARHNLFVLNPSLNLRHDLWRLRVGMTTYSPGLMNLMPFRDARNALSIIEGNPSLKDNRRINANMSYQARLKTKQTGVTAARLTSSYTYHIRSVAQGFTYDELTNAYTYRPVNVEGNWSWNTSYNTTLSLNKNQLWWMDSSTGCNVWHSVDYASVAGMTDAQLNKVETVSLHEELKMSYKGKNTKVGMSGNLHWRRTWGHRPTFSNISAFDFQYGVNAMQTIPAWNTTFNVDAMMLSRRGYGSDAMNKDEFVLNASITQPLLHGKVKLTLEGHDLLHQLSNTTYEVNAQGRTETWYRVIPNYVMIRVAWQYQRSPKH
ncbi:MAG: outer membrane beta-barrel protein [Bacteroidaceae bacterium]|nr:outer membrane beta-barrel protein [Bacteroidaceae bacterium]